ncbi:MerR family transcriptional regulator [Streptomyces sp. NPDC005931]|uniref:MerR family transcriptional regulator n=1 Tax=Streptomyces sp. NPDC005931 TaxID=3364737 RepID=UPI0036783F05
MDEFTTMGELAERTRPSRRALRLYGERGLLVPARVEAGGVRRYGSEQVARARRIALMRSVGMPPARVGELLDLRGGEAAAPAEYRRAREAEHAAGGRW